MSFLDEIQKSSSEKFSLIRLRPKRSIAVTSVGSNLYSCAIDLNVFECFIGKSKLDLVDGVPSAGEFSFDSTTNTLTVYSSDSISSVIIGHYLYLATDKNRAIGKDPIYPNRDLVEWMGRLAKNPTFNQSLQNINAGIVTISTSSIDLINHDGLFDYFFSKVDSLLNCKFDVWYCCNGVENIQFAFSGVTVESSQNGLILSIKTKDLLELLNSTCYMGDTINEATLSSSTYPNIKTDEEGKPIPYLIGRVSNFGIKIGSIGTLTIGSTLDYQSLRKASCVSFNSSLSNTTNRNWVANRSLFNGGITGSYTYSSLGVNYTFDLLTSEDASRFLAFDIFKAGSAYFKVVSIFGNFVSCTKLTGPDPSSPCLITLITIPIVAIESSGIIYECIPLRDYTISSYLTSGGNNINQIQFINGFETSVGMPNALNPSEDIVYYRAISIDINHDDAANIIISSSGIDQSFSGSGVTSNVCMMIPATESDDFESSLTYLEKICRSNATYLFQNNNGFFDYKAFSPTSPNVEITKDDYLSGSLYIDENNQDACTDLVVSTECNNVSGYNFYKASSDSVATLVGVPKTRKIVSILSSIQSIRDEVIYQNLFKTTSYRFKLKTIGYNWTIGKEVKIKGKDLVVIGIDKGLDDLNITAVDTFTTA